MGRPNQTERKESRPQEDGLRSQAGLLSNSLKVLFFDMTWALSLMMSRWWGWGRVGKGRGKNTETPDSECWTYFTFGRFKVPKYQISEAHSSNRSSSTFPCFSSLSTLSTPQTPTFRPLRDLPAANRTLHRLSFREPTQQLKLKEKTGSSFHACCLSFILIS